MKIKFYAHACFRIEGDGRTIVTDPYDPEISRFDPVDEPADLVLMSSNTDVFHCDPSHVLGDPAVVNTLDLPTGGAEVEGGLHVTPYKTRERIQWRLLLGHGILPRACAMYWFELDGLRVLHTGDLGKPMSRKMLAALEDRVDVVFALTGGVHNIEPGKLKEDLDRIRPRVIVPMHYYSPKGRLKNLPVTDWTGRYREERVVWVDGPELEVTSETLPDEPTVYVLEQSR